MHHEQGLRRSERLVGALESVSVFVVGVTKTANRYYVMYRSLSLIRQYYREDTQHTADNPVYDCDVERSDIYRPEDAQHMADNPVYDCDVW